MAIIGGIPHFQTYSDLFCQPRCWGVGFHVRLRWAQHAFSGSLGVLWTHETGAWLAQRWTVRFTKKNYGDFTKTQWIFGLTSTSWSYCVWRWCNQSSGASSFDSFSISSQGPWADLRAPLSWRLCCGVNLTVMVQVIITGLVLLGKSAINDGFCHQIW